MNLNALNPLAVCLGLLRQRALIGQLVHRDVLLRYRGALFGLAWLFLGPLLMLAIFAFVFGQIFQSRWPQQGAGIPLWLMLYSGLIAFNVLAETLSRAPTSVRGYPGYVKKIVFPLELLPLVPLGVALVHAVFNLMILLLALAWIGAWQGSLLLLPVLLLPVLPLALGGAWFLAAWGVFLKDTAQLVPLLVQMLLFLSPVFYPRQAVPEPLQPLYRYNPVGVVIEAWQAAMVGGGIDWQAWSVALLGSLLAGLLGLAFFQHSREEFADVL